MSRYSRRYNDIVFRIVPIRLDVMTILALFMACSVDIIGP